MLCHCQPITVYVLKISMCDFHLNDFHKSSNEIMEWNIFFVSTEEKKNLEIKAKERISICIRTIWISSVADSQSKFNIIPIWLSRVISERIKFNELFTFTEFKCINVTSKFLFEAFAKILAYSKFESQFKMSNDLALLFMFKNLTKNWNSNTKFISETLAPLNILVLKT